MVVVEALNTWDNGAVILANTRDALQLINSIDAINIQYQYDVSHM
jgi:hydroxypyruvate isomerase